MPHCSAASMTLARIRSLLTRETWVCRVSTGCSARGAHLDRLLHHVVEPGVLQRRKDIGDVGQAILRPRLRDDGQAVGPLAAVDLRPAIRRRGR